MLNTSSAPSRTITSSNALYTSSDVDSIDSWPFDDLGSEAHITLQHTTGRQLVSRISGNATEETWRGSQTMIMSDSAHAWERLQLSATQSIAETAVDQQHFILPLQNMQETGCLTESTMLCY